MERESASPPPTTTKRTRLSYSVEFKLHVIEHAKTSSQRKTAKHFNIDESQVRRWQKNSQNLQAVTKKSSRKQLTKVRVPRYLELEHTVSRWVIERIDAGEKVNGKRVLEEARKLAFSQGLFEFKGSLNWVYSFMKRNGFWPQKKAEAEDTSVSLDDKANQFKTEYVSDGVDHNETDIDSDEDDCDNDVDPFEICSTVLVKPELADDYEPQ